tara:strand:- start:776 stop:1348 length:573 start_codon:yes stop_codon:yes gene_type:complete
MFRQIEDTRYSISNEGVVRNDTRGSIVKLQLNPSNSYYFTCSQGGKRHNMYLTGLMRKYWQYEWIKELDDDEEAMPIRGYKGYFITNKGRVFSLKRYRWLEPSDSFHTCKYYTRHKLNRETYNTHMLVGRHFLDWKPGLLVLHRDETLSPELINCADNLWIGTSADNAQDMWSKGRANTKRNRDIDGRYV